MIVSIKMEQEPGLIRIRGGTAEDAQLLAEIGAETFYDTYAPDLPADRLADYIPTAFSIEIQAAELADPANMFLIAEVGGAAAGYAMLSEEMPPEELAGKRAVKLPRIYLHQSYIGRGIGSALMEACLEEAGRQGFEVIWLGVWERNINAQAFYRKWGFVEMGAEEFPFGDEIQTDLLFFRLMPVVSSR